MFGEYTVYIPTYHRPKKLRRCLESVVKEIDKYELNDVFVQISSNDANDFETYDVVNEFSRHRPYIRYHANEFNIGIDKNHDLLYEYCETKYVLQLADDDVMLDGTLKRIQDNCQDYDFLFAICNQRFFRNGVISEDNLIDRNDVTLLTKDEAFREFTVEKPDFILPLIPYYGGVVIDMEKVNSLISSADRKKFDGTFHQYIGCLWYALINSNEKFGLFANISIGQGFDDDKTWFDYKDEVFKNAKRLYEILPISVGIRREIYTLIKYSGRKMGKIIIPILKIKSRRWRL